MASLCSGSDPIDIYRSQGYVQAVDALDRAYVDLRRMLTKLEEAQS